jgi:hypothetical protein
VIFFLSTMRSHFTAPVAMLFLPIQAYNLDGAMKRRNI